MLESPDNSFIPIGGRSILKWGRNFICEVLIINISVIRTCLEVKNPPSQLTALTRSGFKNLYLGIISYMIFGKNILISIVHYDSILNIDLLKGKYSRVFL
jgi:hypothetical protein